MKLRPSILLCTTLAFTGIYGCVNHDLAGPFVVDCSNDRAYSYENDVVPIINANCALSGCHDGSSDLPNWTNYQTLAESVTEVHRRTTLPLNDPDKMPRIGSITTEERQILNCWIEQGALQN